MFVCLCPTGYILSLVLLTLPRQHLVKLYLYVLTALLLFAGHQVSRYHHYYDVTQVSSCSINVNLKLKYLKKLLS